MSCDSNCQPCNNKGGELGIFEFSPPQNAEPGQQVTVNFKVGYSVWLNTSTWFVACLYDSDTGACIASTGEVFIGQFTDPQISVNMFYIQPSNKDFHGNLSLNEWSLFGYSCDDNKLFTVSTNFPPGTKWSCDQATGCFEDVNGQYQTNAACYAACQGSPQGDCFIPSSFCAGGCCLSKTTAKNIALVGLGLLGLYAGYRYVTRNPQKVKQLYSAAREEYGRAKSAFQEMRS